MIPAVIGKNTMKEKNECCGLQTHNVIAHEINDNQMILHL